MNRGSSLFRRSSEDQEEGISLEFKNGDVIQKEGWGFIRKLDK